MDERKGSADPHGLDERLARVAASQHGLISREHAQRLGATQRVILRRLASARWEELYPGVYRVTGSPSSWRQSLLGACLTAGSGAVSSHRAAGGLRSLPGVPAGAIEITVPRGRRLRRKGVRFHETMDLPSMDVASLDGIPTTTSTRTIIDLAAVLPQDRVEEALDDALRRGLTSVSRIRRRLDQLGTRAGSRLMRELIERRSHAGTVPQSVFETRMLRVLRRASLPPPVCQYEVKDEGRVVAVVDFAYPDICLAIETDGYRWHSGRAQWERDLARRNALTSLGWRVIHVTWSDLERRPDQVVRTLQQALK